MDKKAGNPSSNMGILEINPGKLPKTNELNEASDPYTKDDITTPDTILPKCLKAIDTGIATSLKMLNGVKSIIGLV